MTQLHEVLHLCCDRAQQQVLRVEFLSQCAHALRLRLRVSACFGWILPGTGSNGTAFRCRVSTDEPGSSESSFQTNALHTHLSPRSLSLYSIKTLSWLRSALALSGFSATLGITSSAQNPNPTLRSVKLAIRRSSRGQAKLLSARAASGRCTRPIGGSALPQCAFLT